MSRIIIATAPPAPTPALPQSKPPLGAATRITVGVPLGLLYPPPETTYDRGPLDTLLAMVLLRLPDVAPERASARGLESWGRVAPLPADATPGCVAAV